MIDRFSGYIWCKRLVRLDTRSITDFLLTLFLEFGFPLSIRSDNGPQFRSEFASFCQQYHISHSTSSPYYPQSNGLAESGVKIAKKLLRACADSGEAFREALAAFRLMPRADGFSPSQLFFNRNLRGHLPTLPDRSNFALPAVLSSKDRDRKRAKFYFDRKSASLAKFEAGDKVLVQHPESVGNGGQNSWLLPLWPLIFIKIP